MERCGNPGALFVRLSYLLKFYSYIFTYRHDYDCVFVHMNPEYVVLAAPLWRLWGKRVTLWYTHKSVTLSLRIAARLAHLIFTASKESFRLPSYKVRVVGHGIDTSRFASDPQLHDGFVVGTVGRITKSKQLECIIDAAASLSEAVPQTRVHIAGAPATDGDRAYEASIREHANKMLGVRAQFVGPLSHDNVPVFLNGIDVFVNMSQTGSLDKAILEAMACGVPCITTNDAGREVVRVVAPGLVQGTDVAAQLRTVAHWSDDERAAYRTAATAYVTAQHSLPALITRIIGTI